MVLGHLAAAAAQLARRQRGERVQVAHHAARLPERADEVLALRQVDAGLAADRRVDHPQQRRGHVDHRHAAMPHRGGEAGDVGDHPAAEADDDVVAGEADAGEPSAQRLDRGQRLVLLAVADLDDLGRDARIDRRAARRPG